MKQNPVIDPNTGTPQLYGISELAQSFGLTHRAIRLYEDKGLLSPQRINGNRIYSHKDRARLQLILRGKRLGFSLQDIAEFFELYERGDAQHSQLTQLISRIDARVASLEQQRRDIDITLSELAAIRSDAQSFLRDKP